jgi:hypothetical protein
VFSLEKPPASREKKRARDSPMNLDPAPRVNKTPFILTAAGCFAVTLTIGLLAPNRFEATPLIVAVVFLLLSLSVLMVPVILDFIAENKDYVQEERAKVANQVQRLDAAGESLARAAAQIKAVEEAVHKTAHAAENLPYRMQEKLAEFNQQLATTEDEEKERLTEELATLRQGESERLATIADKIHKATGELAALEAATRKSLAAAQDSAVSKFESRLTAALTALDAKLATLTIPVAAAPAPTTHAPAPVVEKQPEPVATTPSVVESVSVTESPAPAAVVEEPKPKKPRAPRKPKPEDTLAAMSEPMPGDMPAESSGEPAFSDSPADSAPAPSEESQAETAATVEPSVSADGATRLLVTAYIGIGNKLYIRGDGPGLSWDKGVPMKFVSIGKWGWATDEATGPVACKLYKNDETAALSGEVFLEPGQHVEVTALF